MSEDVLLYTQNVQESKDEIEKLGGRVTQVFTAAVFIARLPEGVTPDSLEKSQTEPTAELDEASQLTVDAWDMTTSKMAERAMTESETGGLSWDTPGYEAPRHVDNDPELSRLSDEMEKKSLSPAAAPMTTSDYLIGSVAVGIIMVSGTASGLALSAQEKSKIIAEVQEGLNFLANAEPAAGVTFVYDIRDITVSAAPNPVCNSFDGCESIWRTPALQQMGASSVAQYIGNLRTSKGTRWAYAGFFTKYKLFHFAYAYSDYLCMEYSNDGWGPDQINSVFAHETCHVFGAADEYGDCGCGPSGFLQVPNNNCVNCPGAHVECLMNGNTLSICHWSRGQIGWDPRLLSKFEGPPAACSWGNNRIDIFGLDANRDVLQLWWSGGWNRAKLGNGFQNTRFDRQLTSCSWDTNRIDIFGVDANGNVLQLWWNGAWHWSNLGNGFQNTRFAGDMTACSWGSNRIDIFGINTNGNVLQLWWNGAWHWSNLGNGFQNTRFARQLTSCSWDTNRIDIFGVDANGNVLQLWWNGAWHWSNLGNGFQNTRFAGPLAACSWSPGRIDIFGVDANGNVLQLWWNGAWHWSNLGNGFQNTRFAGEITACSWGNNRIDVFGLDANKKMLQLWWNGAWHWNSIS